MPTQNVQASPPVVNTVVELDLCSAMLSHFTIEFALLFTTKAAVADLASALSKILSSFEVLSGRLITSTTRDGAYCRAIRCDNSGIPLTHQVLKGPAPDFSSLLPADLFDLVDARALLDNPETPLMCIKVSDFDEAQVLAVSLSHSVCDANGIGKMLTAWSLAFHGELSEAKIDNDRLAAVPKAPLFGQPPLESVHRDQVPDNWRLVRHLPEACPTMSSDPMVSPVHVSWRSSLADCKALKAKHAQDDIQLSTNDCLSAELVHALGTTYDVPVFPVNMIMDGRGALGSPSLFGNLWFSVEIGVPTGEMKGAVAIRQTLPIARSREFIEWNMGQGHNMSWSSKLSINSWVRAFRLCDIKFGGEAVDVMLGEPMMSFRAATMTTRGGSYCITLPQADGIKVVAILPGAAASALQSRFSNRVTVSAV